MKQAILTSEIMYKKLDGRFVINPIGMKIIVDSEKNIAFNGIDHFDVKPEEYKIIYFN